MTKTLVLGSGIVGRAAAWDLNRRGHEVTVTDISPELAAAVGAELGVPAATLDVADELALDQFFAEADSVVAAVPYTFGERLAAAAIRNTTHYFDFGGNPTIVRHQLSMDVDARAARVAVVPDCGLAPGYANVLAAGMIEAVDRPDINVQIRVGVLPEEPTGSLKYQVAFWVGGLINEYAEPCDIIENGTATTVEPLGRIERLQWKGLGTLEAFSTAGGTSTMCQEYEGKLDHLEYKTIRYPGHAAVFASLRELGFFSEEPRADGRVPRDLLIELLSENLPRGGRDITLIDISLAATGFTRKRRIEDHHDGRFSSLARTTAFPTTALCDLVARGAVDFRGVAAMHSVADSGALAAELEPLGLLASNE